MAKPKVAGVELPVRRVALPAAEIDKLLEPAFPPPPIEVIRPDDLVHLRFSFVNLRLERARAGAAPVLVRRNARRAAFLVVETPSQHITERALFETAAGLPVKDPPPIPGQPPVPHDDDAGKGSDPLLPPPVFASLSGPSRLVFKVGDETVPYTLNGLLAVIGRLDLSVAPHAAPPSFPRVPRFDTIIGTRLDVGPIFAAAGAAPRRAQRRQATGRDRTASLAAELIALGRVRRATAELEYRLGSDTALLAFSTTRLGVAIDAKSTIAGLLGELAIDRLPPLPASPTATETALELPWRLILSPNLHAAFAHSADAVGHDGRTELWHSRLGLRAVDENGKPQLDADGHPFVDEQSPDYRTVRAVWARDFDVLPTLEPQSVYADFKFAAPPLVQKFPAATGDQDRPQVRMALNSRDRMMLVHETSNFHLMRNQTSPWTPPAVPTDRLMLSALGGWLDCKAQMRTLPDGGFSIQEWKHRAALGRDHEVRVVYAGFLLPFGHRASLVKVTERKFADGPSGTTAYLFQRMYIVVQEPSKTFRDDIHTVAPGDTRRLDLVMPFASVTLLTRATPLLDKPADLLGSGGFVFVPRVAGADFPFKVLTMDLEGNLAEFSAPLMFVERDHNDQTGDLAQVLSAYNHNGTPANPVQRAFDLHGQRVSYAPSQAADDTTLATQSVSFQVVAPPHLAHIPQDEPRFLPVLDEAQAVVPAMSALAGAASPVRLRYPAHYAAQGYDANAAQVFLEVLDAPKLGFAGQGDRSGGFVTPSLDVTGLSRLTGPIGGKIDDAVAGGTFDIKRFFDSAGAKLFGLIPLSDLLPATPFLPDKVPAFVAQTLDVATTLKQNVERLRGAADAQAAAIGAAATQLADDAQALLDLLVALAANPEHPPDLAAGLGALAADLSPFIAALDAAPLPEAQKRNVAGVARRVQDQLEDAGAVAAAAQALVQFAKGLKLPDVITARLDWSTALDPWPAGGNPIFQPTDANGADAAQGNLSLAVDIQAPTRPGKTPNVLVACSISPFDLRLIAPVTTFLRLRFATMEFSIEPGKKPDVNVKFRPDGGIVFDGPLTFVNTLKDIIPSDGFSDPPYLDVSTDGIKAGFDLAIPDLAVGIFALQNIALGAAFKVPFIAESIETAFNFCTRENPFRLSVSLFAGGGFFGITITPQEVRILEAALEFGAAISINLGVASGGVSVMAGIYFRLESGDAALTGYFRLRGEVDVLGLISASLELYLALTYETATGKAVGRATLTIEVHVLFFSAAVEVSCEKKFAGANGDPSFVDLMGLPPGAPAGAVRPWDAYCHAFADD